MSIEPLSLEGVLTFAEDHGVTAALFPTVREEAENNLFHSVQERAQDEDYLNTQRILDRAEGKLSDLLRRVREADPEIQRNEVDSLREEFQDLDKDMPRYAEKDPIPDDPDLMIMLQASKLSFDTVFIISRDKHFLAYEDELREWFGIEVVDGRDVPFLRSRWE